MFLDRPRGAFAMRSITRRHGAPASICGTFAASTSAARIDAALMPQNANQSVENLHAIGRTMMTATSVESVGGIGDDQERRVVLHRTLKRIAKARAFLDTREAAMLREAQQLRLWKEFGYTSLVDYMGAELGYTPRAAEDRLRV